MSNDDLALYVILTVIILFFLLLIHCLLERRKFRNLISYGYDEPKRHIPSDLYDFKCEKVTTDDGYILALFRIRHKQKYNKNLPPVLMQHGLSSSAINFIMGGEEKSPSLVLAQEGFDVYLGNSRGSVYSMDHVSLNVGDKKYWEWSFQDMRLDIKAFFEHIWKEKNKKINYIGHSNGSVGMLAALSDPLDRSTANYIESRLDTFYCLSPVVYSKGNEILPFKLPMWFIKTYFGLNRLFGIHASFPAKEKISISRVNRVNKRKTHNKKHALYWTEKSNEKNNTDLYGFFESYHPHGCSFQAVEHFMQIHKREPEDYFKMFDYGLVRNIMEYGSSVPPSYDFSLVKSKIRVYYGDMDKFISIDGIHLLGRKLANADCKLYLLNGYGHVSFTLGTETDKFFSTLIPKDKLEVAEASREGDDDNDKI